MNENKTIRTFSLLLLSGVGFIIHFISAPFLARSLTLEDNGIYNQTILVVDIAFMLFSLGISNVTYLYLKRKDFSRYDVFWGNLMLAFSVGVLGAFLIFFVSPLVADYFSAPDLENYLKIYCLVVFFRLPLGVTEAAVILFGRIRAFTQRSLILAVFKTGSLILIIQLTQNLTLVFSAFVLLNLIQLLYSLFLVPKVFYQNISWKKKTMVKMLGEGFIIALNSIFGKATLLMDKTIVSSMLMPQQFAIYRNGAIEIPFFSGIYRTISTTVLPELSRLFSEGKIHEIVRLKQKAIANTAFIIYPVLIFLLFFNDRFIFLYLSERYMGSVPVFTIFNLTLLIRINSYGDIILVAGKYKTLIKITAIGFLLGVALNIIFIKAFGYIGAAIATLITIAAINYFYLVLTSRILKIPIFAFFDFTYLFKILLLCSLLAFGLSKIPADRESVVMFLATVLFYAVICYYIILRYFMKDKSVILIISEKVPFFGKTLKKIIERW